MAGFEKAPHLPETDLMVQWEVATQGFKCFAESREGFTVQVREPNNPQPTGHHLAEYIDKQWRAFFTLTGEGQWTIITFGEHCFGIIMIHEGKLVVVMTLGVALAIGKKL